MPRKLRIPELELKILQHLWDLNDCATVQDVLDNWKGLNELRYTTILKKLQIMEKKGLVRHEKAGRAYKYIPLISRKEVIRKSIEDVLRGMFAGSKVAFVNALFEDRDLTKEEINQLKALIEKKEEELDGSN